MFLCFRDRYPEKENPPFAKSDIFASRQMQILSMSMIFQFYKMIYFREEKKSMIHSMV